MLETVKLPNQPEMNMPDLPSEKTMYQAIADKDTSFEGIFVVAVKTTGIFCRPGCSARTPKRENVEFFGQPREALEHGYRPCKVCKPMNIRGEVPDWLKPLLEEINAEPGIRLKDQDIRERGLDPNRVRRWFQKHHGMTFQAFLRTLRIGQAFGQIRHGESVTGAAFDSGYESLSGFGESFKKITNFAPVESSSKSLVKVTRILTPLGPMLAGATDEGICLLEFIDRRMMETQLKRINGYLNAQCVPGEHPHLDTLSTQLTEYFEKKREDFDLPLTYPGTDFQKSVWEILRTIPYGTTWSYQQEAEKLGNPKAVRAVAKANGDNRIAIIIPCHRVIGKDGKLAGYGGGLWRKRWLLDHEMGSLALE